MSSVYTQRRPSVNPFMHAKPLIRATLSNFAQIPSHTTPNVAAGDVAREVQICSCVQVESDLRGFARVLRSLLLVFLCREQPQCRNLQPRHGCNLLFFLFFRSPPPIHIQIHSFFDARLCSFLRRCCVAKTLIIVESPAKAKTIAKFLKGDYIVESSIGHIRDLPASAEDIPAAYKDKPWSRLGVDVENNFKPLYIVPATKRPQVKKLKELLTNASELYLATDEDREGEAIAWHLREVLKPTVPVKRMCFHEITQKAIEHAIKNPRQLDDKLVDAQEARRILDRLFGYEVSPILWRKVAPRLSAGRVQSVATRLIVERERLRIAFKSGDYWSVDAVLQKHTEQVEKKAADGKNKDVSIAADLVELAGRRIATSRDFDPNTGKIAEPEKTILLDEKRAVELKKNLEVASYTVKDVNKRPFTQKPYAPFITSTLQQEAGRKLRYTAQRTMRIAQRLYETGYITYMRTDSTTLSQEAISAARAQVAELFGENFVPDVPRVYAGKVKGAQEAHEAIRPAGDRFRTPEQVQRDVDEESYKLYDLIWKRTIASQMKDAVGERTQVRIGTSVEINGKKLDCVLTTSGKTISFPGYLRAYVEGSDDPEAELEDKERILPPLAVGDVLDPNKVDIRKHTTQPPSRYTEASLVKDLEDRGIGRPSTYASIIQTIQDRGYVFKKNGALVPTFTAFAVINLLQQHLGDLVDYAFTARMESDLDAISSGEMRATPWLTKFYFGTNGPPPPAPVVEGAADEAGKAKKTTKKKAEAKAADGTAAPAGTTAPAGKTPDGKTPDSKNPENKTAENKVVDGPLAEIGLRAKVASGGEGIDARGISCLPLGTTEDGQLVAARVGRFGAYVQIGDTEQRANIPSDIAPDELTVTVALDLIRKSSNGARVLGKDPSTNQNVYVKTGRFGPYIQRGEMPQDKKTDEAATAETTATSEVKATEVADAATNAETNTEAAGDGKKKKAKKEPKPKKEKPVKPKLASVWPVYDPETITLVQAIQILQYPKILGKHPETGATIVASDGKFGPYLIVEEDGTDAKGETRTLPNAYEDLASIDLEKAVTLLASPKPPRQRAARGSVEPLARLGVSAVTGKNIEIRTGKFGPYVTDGQVNATIPTARDPANLTFDDALELIAAREEYMKERGQEPRPAPKTPRAKKSAEASDVAGAGTAASTAPVAANTASETADATGTAKTTKKKAAAKTAATKTTTSTTVETTEATETAVPHKVKAAKPTKAAKAATDDTATVAPVVADAPAKVAKKTVVRKASKTSE